MRAVHNHKEDKLSVAGNGDDNLLAAAREHEAAGDNENAVALYGQALKKYPQQASIYDRLMILHRKDKAYKKELAVINAGIKEFTALLQPARNLQGGKVASLSKSILRSVGLADKKDRPLYYPQPIARWQKRKKTVQQKLESK